MLLFLESWKS